MSKTKWFSGPPPSRGWWPASRARMTGTLRWWNGSHWSLPAYVDECTAKQAANKARLPAFGFPDYPIEWTHRPSTWPKRSMT
jgi:hypothetical protein